MLGRVSDDVLGNALVRFLSEVPSGRLFSLKLCVPCAAVRAIQGQKSNLLKHIKRPRINTDFDTERKKFSIRENPCNPQTMFKCFYIGDL